MRNPDIESRAAALDAADALWDDEVELVLDRTRGGGSLGRMPNVRFAIFLKVPFRLRPANVGAN